MQGTILHAIPYLGQESADSSSIWELSTIFRKYAADFQSWWDCGNSLENLEIWVRLRGIPNADPVLPTGPSATLSQWHLKVWT